MNSEQTKTIEVGTVLGKMLAKVSEDTDSPGIHIFLEQADSSGQHTRQLADVRSAPIGSDHVKILRLQAWGDEDEVAPAATVVYADYIPPEEQLKRTLWAEYLQYLRDWSKEYAEPKYANTKAAPLSFDYWKVDALKLRNS
jgi:hypothetical protein